jgi:molybdopterin-guanine dinucleotide biosynthesis protein A
MNLAGTNLAAMILAGGRSQRMGGGDKSLLQLGGETILARVAARIRPQVAALALNANGDPARFAGYDLGVIPDGVTGYAGPLAGILTALDWSARAVPDASHILTVAADTPFLPHDLVARLKAAINAGAVAAVPQSGGRVHHVIGLWPVAQRDLLRRMLVDEGVRRAEDWVRRIGAVPVGFEAQPFDPFFNVNTPADLEAASAMLDGK